MSFVGASLIFCIDECSSLWACFRSLYPTALWPGEKGSGVSLPWIHVPMGCSSMNSLATVIGIPSHFLDLSVTRFPTTNETTTLAVQDAGDIYTDANTTRVDPAHTLTSLASQTPSILRHGSLSVCGTRREGSGDLGPLYVNL